MIYYPFAALPRATGGHTSYFNKVGATLWTLFADPMTLARMVERLESTYVIAAMPDASIMKFLPMASDDFWKSTKSFSCHGQPEDPSDSHEGRRPRA